MRFKARLITGGAAFKSANFRWLSIGAGLNSAGMPGEQVILGFMIYQLTNSSIWVGISLALFFAPMLIVGVPAGVLADRFDRRRLLLITEATLVLSLAVFALCLLFTDVGVSGILVMSALSGTLRSVHQPARLSYAGSMAGSSGLVAALSMLSVTSRFGQLIGAFVAGAVGDAVSAGAAYGVLAAIHLLAFMAFAKTGYNQPERPDRHAVIEDDQSKHRPQHAITDFLAVFRSSRSMVVLLVLASLAEVLGFSFATAMPEIAIDRLDVDSSGLGAMHSMRAVGGLAGAVVLSLLTIKHIGSLFTLVLMGFGIAICYLSVATQMNQVLVAVCVIAFFASSTDILVQSMMQICLPAAMRGRAMGAWVFALGMGPVGHLELGFLMAVAGTTAALATNGALLVLTGLLSYWFLPELRNLKNTLQNT